MSIKRTVLITGGCGFIGLNLAKFLTQENYRIILFDIKYPLAPHLIKNAEIIIGDLRSAGDISDAFNKYDIE